MNDDRATAASHSEELSSGKMSREVGPEHGVYPRNLSAIGTSVDLVRLLHGPIAIKVTQRFVDRGSAGEREDGDLSPIVRMMQEQIERDRSTMYNAIKRALKDKMTVAGNESDLGAEVAVGDADGLAEPGADEAGTARNEDASTVEGS